MIYVEIFEADLGGGGLGLKLHVWYAVMKVVL